jgi:hypothetical protein
MRYDLADSEWLAIKLMPLRSGPQYPVRPQYFFSYSIARTRPAAVARSCLLPFLIIHTLALVYDRFTEGFETADLKLTRAA